MEIKQNKVDDLNATLNVVIEKADFTDKVEKTLKEYRKNASISGFRKGMVPMTFIRKQYEKPLIYEEVNKLLQTEIDKYLLDEKIEILGQPIPVEDKDFDWEKDSLEFNFEIGLAPEFDLNIKDLELPYHKIEVTEEEVDKYTESFRKQFGKMQEADEVKNGAYLKGVFYELNEEGKEGEHFHATIALGDVKNADLFLGKKLDERVEVEAKELFDNENRLQEVFGLEDEELKEFNPKLSFKIDQITIHEAAEINQELFDKVYGEDEVKTEEEFKAKIKEEAEKMYESEADRVMLTAGLMELVEKTSFDLPKEFLIKWLKFSRKEPMTDKEAEEMYNKSEKGIRFQLIEGEIAKEFELSVTPEEVSDKALETIKQQMKAYGAGMKFEDEQLKQFAQSALQNKEEYQRLADQIFAEKMMGIFKEKAQLKEKKLSFDDFLEEVKAQNAKNQTQENLNDDESE